MGLPHAATVLPAWLDGSGIALENLQTPYGSLSYSLRKEENVARLHVEGGMRLPPGGLVLSWPEGNAPGATRINGKVAAWNGNELRIAELPADVRVNLKVSR